MRHAEIRVQFEEWQDLDNFTARVKEHRPAKIRDGGFKFWLEAWVASRFSQLMPPPERIRLTPHSAKWGDFEVVVSGSRAPFEITEALDEEAQPLLKTLREREAFLPTSEDELSGDMARRLIPHLIEKKAAKGYPAETSLIIYLNLDDDELSMDELPGLVPSTEYKFHAIWVLYCDGDTAHQIYPSVQVLGRERATA